MISTKESFKTYILNLDSGIQTAALKDNDGLFQSVDSLIDGIFQELEKNPELSSKGLELFGLYSLLRESIAQKGVSNRVSGIIKGKHGVFEGKGKGESKKAEKTKDYKSSKAFYSFVVNPSIVDVFFKFAANKLQTIVENYEPDMSNDVGDILLGEYSLTECWKEWKTTDSHKYYVSNYYKFLEKFKAEKKYTSFLETIPFAYEGWESLGDNGIVIICSPSVFADFLGSSFVDYGFTWLGKPRESQFTIRIHDIT